MLSRNEIEKLLTDWQEAWDAYDLDGLLEFFHDDVYFEKWSPKKSYILE